MCYYQQDSGGKLVLGHEDVADVLRETAWSCSAPSGSLPSDGPHRRPFWQATLRALRRARSSSRWPSANDRAAPILVDANTLLTAFPEDLGSGLRERLETLKKQVHGDEPATPAVILGFSITTAWAESPPRPRLPLAVGIQHVGLLLDDVAVYFWRDAVEERGTIGLRSQDAVSSCRELELHDLVKRTNEGLPASM